MRILRPFVGAALFAVAALLAAAPASAQTTLKFDTFTPYHTFFQSFDNYAAADWIITTTEAGAGDATEAIGNLDNGILVVTNDAADDDKDCFQYSGADATTTVETFKYEAGKALYFAARFKVSDATQSDLVFGLQITDTTPLAVTDGIFFGKDDGDAHLDFHVEKNSTETATTSIVDLVADTYIKVAFYYPGSGDKIKILINDAEVGSSVLTNVVDDEELVPSFCVQNGEAVAKVLSVDYILAMKAR